MAAMMALEGYHIEERDFLPVRDRAMTSENCGCGSSGGGGCTTSITVHSDLHSSIDLERDLKIEAE